MSQSPIWQVPPTSFTGASYLGRPPGAGDDWIDGPVIYRRPGSWEIHVAPHRWEWESDGIRWNAVVAVEAGTFRPGLVSLTWAPVAGRIDSVAVPLASAELEAVAHSAEASFNGGPVSTLKDAAKQAGKDWRYYARELLGGGPHEVEQVFRRTAVDYEEVAQTYLAGVASSGDPNGSVGHSAGIRAVALKSGVGDDGARKQVGRSADDGWLTAAKPGQRTPRGPGPRLAE